LEVRKKKDKKSQIFYVMIKFQPSSFILFIAHEGKEFCTKQDEGRCDGAAMMEQ